MTTIEKVIAALKLAEAARQYADVVCQREQAQRALDDAYSDWKRRNHVCYVERNSIEWDHMMADTGDEYRAGRSPIAVDSNDRDALVKLAKGGA